MYFTNNWGEMIEAASKISNRIQLGDVSVTVGLKELAGTLTELNRANFK
jgi:hypothetical protein